jgi:multiple sugar transport system permease protein
MIRRLNFAGLVLALVTAVASVAWAFPLVWAILTTVAPQADGTPLDGLAVYAKALFGTPIGLWYLNSLVTSGTVTLVVIAISSAAGYAISQLEFWGRKALWYLILASFMIPVQALIVNHFLLMNSWKLINTWAGVILPQLIAPIAVIVYKQFFDSVPRELSEAAKVDGASHARLLWSIYLPVNWGVTAALAIIVFIGAWNAFLWPFLVVTKEPLMNVTVAIGQVEQYLGVGGLAAALLAGLPVALVYLVFQKKVTEAIMLSSGIKG